MAGLKLSRDQLAQFLKNHEQIKQFENLFSEVDASTSTLEAVAIEAANASAKANLIDGLRELVEQALIESGNARAGLNNCLSLINAISNDLNLTPSFIIDLVVPLISAVTLQKAYDNSPDPEILTDATRRALSVKIGTGSNSDYVYEGMNAAGAITFSVNGFGDVTGRQLNGVTLTNAGSGLNLLADDGAYYLYTDFAAPLQNSYNNSIPPEILTAPGIDALILRRGTAADTDDVLVVQNNAGTVKFSVTGNGVTTAPTVYGSSSASGDLTLGSTSNATKGRVLIGTSIYDEVNNKFGVGVGAGNFAAALDIVSLGNATTCLRFQDKTTRLPLLNMEQGGAGNCNFLFYNISADNTVVLAAGTGQATFLGGATAGSMRKAGVSAGSVLDVVGAGGVNCLNTTGITLAAESITNGALTSGTSWTASGDASLAGNKAVFTYSTGALSYINQTTAAMAIALKSDTYYCFTMTITGATANANGYAVVTLNDGSNQSTFIAYNRSLVFYFKTKSGPTQFRLTATLTSGQAFTIDDISCKEVTSGGLYTGGGSNGLNITPDGRLYGTALHNNAGAVTGATNQYIASGTYTPTLTNVTNVAASTARLCTWLRVGNSVRVWGQLDIDLTTTLLASEIGVSLPIASALTTAYQLAGTANALASQSNWGIQADAANDRAQFKATGIVPVTNDTYTFDFGYEVL